MDHHVADFLASNTEVTLIAPSLVVLVAAVRARRGGRWPLRDSAYIASCLSLAAACVLLHIVFMLTPINGVPFSLARALVGVCWLIALVTPQAVVALVMGGVAVVRKRRNAAYRSPSYWWFVGVAIAGSAWTRFAGWDLMFAVAVSQGAGE
jgi:hypothetical protein